MTLLSMLASAETVVVDGIRYNLISRAIKESGIFNLCYALWSQMYTCERFLCFYLPYHQLPLHPIDVSEYRSQYTAAVMLWVYSYILLCLSGFVNS